MQDRRGFIWFATDNGVSRFDGSHFKNYSMSDGLSDNDVLRIIEDDEGRLWFLTFNGKLSFYQNDKIYNSTNNNLLKKLQFADFITSFFQDSKKNIWICSIDGTVTQISVSDSIKQFRDFNKILQIWENKSGQLKFMSTNAIYSLNHQKLSFTKLPDAWLIGTLLSDDSLLLIDTANQIKILHVDETVIKTDTIKNQKINNVSGLSVDNKKNIWISTLNGVIEFEDGIVSSKFEYHYFNNCSITSVVRDRYDNLWFSSMGKGIFMIPSTNIFLYDEKTGLADNNVTAIMLINSHKLITGSYNGAVQIIDQTGIKNYNSSLINSIGHVMKITKDHNNDTWILTTGGIYKYSSDNFEKLKFAHGTSWDKTLFIDHEGAIWIGWGRGLKKIVNGKIIIVSYGEKVNRVHAITQLYKNELLLGTDHGLYKYKNGETIRDTIENPQFSHCINDLAISDDSTLWIATDANGLMSLKNGKVSSYTTKDHLLSDHCNNLLADSNTIYLATNNGLNIIRSENNIVHIISYSTANGLVSNHINQIIKKDKNNFILATDKGIVEFDERKLPKSVPSDPYLNSVIINDSAQQLLSYYDLNYNNNNIRIDFGAINFNSAGNIYYRYKLIGVDANWNYTIYTSVKYSYLHPGNYTFIVATQNADGSWNPKTASFSFFIETPWWQTWWFRTLVGLCLIGTIYLIVRWRFNAYKQKINRERALSESELKALRSQINPHFIYNSLNAIQDFILQNQKEDAHLYLTKFATLMRSILSHSRASTVSLEEEITSLSLYLELETLRFNNQFTFQFIVDEQIDTEYVQIPSMILQPYIENAILHGLATINEGGKIIISFSLKNNFLVSTIEDNGIGRKKAAESRKQRIWKGHKSLGMAVTQERIDLISHHQKEKTRIEISDLVNETNTPLGTRVTIYFPLAG